MSCCLKALGMAFGHRELLGLTLFCGGVLVSLSRLKLGVVQPFGAVLCRGFYLPEALFCEDRRRLRGAQSKEVRPAEKVVGRVSGNHLVWLLCGHLRGVSRH